jgi:hypothetical protein
VEPETISESSSPIAFKFLHNVAFKYARFSRYIGTSISGEEAGEPETVSESFCTRDETGRDGTGRDETEPQQRVAG